MKANIWLKHDTCKASSAEENNRQFGPHLELLLTFFDAEKDLLEEAVRKSLSEKVNENDLIAEATRVSLTDSNSSNDDPEEEEILEEALRLSLEEKERAESEENELIRRALEASMMIS